MAWQKGAGSTIQKHVTSLSLDILQHYILNLNLYYFNHYFIGNPTFSKKNLVKKSKKSWSYSPFLGLSQV